MSANTPSDEKEDAPGIDTSQMSEGQRAAVELTESARDAMQKAGSAQKLFMGTLDLSDIYP
ncbi:MAG: hypothetical protein JJU29_20610, partial [Verrucomicrobia bacterium]|nr:hypothetical protein [Verrucomicrobiota bacterium]